MHITRFDNLIYIFITRATFIPASGISNISNGSLSQTEDDVAS